MWAASLPLVDRLEEEARVERKEGSPPPPATRYYTVAVLLFLSSELAIVLPSTSDREADSSGTKKKVFRPASDLFPHTPAQHNWY
jgi:hypothetical protein